MEAGTGGAPVSGAASTGDAQIDAALRAVEDHLSQATSRVTTDLATLRDDVAKAQEAGLPVDHAILISRLTAILEVVDGIDPQQAAAGGTATTTGTAADGAAAGAVGGEAPDPSAPATTASQGTPAGGAAAGGGSAAPAGGVPAQPQSADAHAVYTFSGDPSVIDASAWPRANVVTEDGRPLYNYSGDSAPGEQHGNGLAEGQWQVYTGNVRPASV